MALSEQEQRVLDEIENALYREDPHFGQSVGVGKESNFSLRVIALLVVGLAVLVGGIALCQFSLWFVALSVVGFIIMFGAGYWALRGRADSNGKNANSSTTPFSVPSQGQTKAKAPFSGRFGNMEDNFRKRFE